MRILLGFFCISVFFIFNGCTSLNDYDDRPTVSVAQGSHGKEPSDAATFLFTMTAASKNDVTVNFSLAGTARMDVDYTNPGASIVIPKGATAATLSIAPIDNSIFETPNRTIVVTLAEGTGYKIGANHATVEIQENETPPTPPINRVPNIKTVSATKTEIHDRTTRVDFPLEVEDDGPLDRLTWTISPSSSIAKIEYIQSKWTFMVFPPEKSTGVYRFGLTVSDGNSVSTPRTFVVEMTNKSLQIQPFTQTKQVTEDDNFTFNPSDPELVTDPDSDTLIYFIKDTDKPKYGSLNLKNAQTGECKYTADPTEVAKADEFSLSVTDGIDVKTIRVPIQIHPLPRVQIFPVQDGSESGTHVQFRIDLNQGADANVNVFIQLSGSATHGVLYQEPTLPIVIPKGATNAILDIIPVPDNDLREYNIIATLEPCDGAKHGSATIAAVKILNDDFNQAPQVTTRALTAHFGQERNFVLEAQDDQFGESITWEKLSISAGTAILSATQGTLRFSPPTSTWTGSATLVVRVSDGLASSTSAVIITLTDDATPQIQILSQERSVPYDDTLPVTLQTNDADGDILTVTATASHGAITWPTPGSVFKYTPNNNSYLGNDTVTITASDGLKSSSATMPIMVIEPIPTILNITKIADSIDGSSSATFAVIFSKSRPSDLSISTSFSGTTLRNVHFSATTPLILTGGATRANLVIVPVNDADSVHQAPRTLTLTVLEGVGYSLSSTRSATMIIADGDLNNPPLLPERIYRIQHDKPLSNKVLEVENDDDEGANYQWTLGTVPTGCSATLSSVGLGNTAQFTFVPPPSATGIYIQKYTVTDEYLPPVSGTITIVVENHRPVFVSSNAFTIARNKTLEYSPQVNDGDDNDDLVLSCSSTTSHGRVDPNEIAAGRVKYEPEDNYVGTDSFVLRVWDGCESATQCVYVSVERPSVSVTVEKNAWKPDGQGSFLVQIPLAIPEDLEITYSLTGTAQTSEYTFTPQLVLFIPHDATQARLKIDIDPEAIITESKTLVFTVQPDVDESWKYDVGIPMSATMELRRQEKPEVWTEFVQDGSVGSATQAPIFCVRLSQHADTDLVVSLSATGTAVAGTDYVLPNPFDVTVPRGSLSATKALEVKLDPATNGDDKTLIIGVNAGNSYEVSASQASLRIEYINPPEAVAWRMNPEPARKTPNPEKPIVLIPHRVSQRLPITAEISCSHPF